MHDDLHPNEREALKPTLPLVDRQPPPSVQAMLASAASGTAALNQSIPAQHRTKRPQPIRLPFDVQKLGSITFVIAVAGLIWWLDGFFTLQFVNGESNWLHQRVHAFHWLLPWGVTVGTLYLWPSKQKREVVRRLKDAWLDDQLESSYQKFARARKTMVISILFWLGLLLFNIGTSTTGVVSWGAGRTIGLFGGFTLPQDGSTLRVLAILIGALGAFAPEQLLKWAEVEWNTR